MAQSQSTTGALGKSPSALQHNEPPSRSASRDCVADQLQAFASGRSVTVARAPRELYGFWRNWANLAKFCGEPSNVDSADDRRARCVISSNGTDHELEGVIDEETPHERIVWHMQRQSEPVMGGRLEFRPAGGARGTVVTVHILERRHSKAMQRLEKLFQRDAQSHAMQELRRFKQWIETGEIATAQRPAAARRA